MKYIALLLISIALLACKKEIVATDPCANNQDVLLPEEKQWIDYKKGNSVVFISSTTQKKFVFKVTGYYLEYPVHVGFCSHRYIISQTAFNNKSLEYRIIARLCSKNVSYALACDDTKIIKFIIILLFKNIFK